MKLAASSGPSETAGSGITQAARAAASPSSGWGGRAAACQLLPPQAACSSGWKMQTVVAGDLQP